MYDDGLGEDKEFMDEYNDRPIAHALRVSTFKDTRQSDINEVITTTCRKATQSHLIPQVINILYDTWQLSWPSHIRKRMPSKEIRVCAVAALWHLEGRKTVANLKALASRTGVRSWDISSVYQQFSGTRAVQSEPLVVGVAATDDSIEGILQYVEDLVTSNTITISTPFPPTYMQHLRENLRLMDELMIMMTPHVQGGEHDAVVQVLVAMNDATVFQSLPMKSRALVFTNQVYCSLREALISYFSGSQNELMSRRRALLSQYLTGILKTVQEHFYFGHQMTTQRHLRLVFGALLRFWNNQQNITTEIGFMNRVSCKVARQEACRWCGEMYQVRRVHEQRCPLRRIGAETDQVDTKSLTSSVPMSNTPLLDQHRFCHVSPVMNNIGGGGGRGFGRVGCTSPFPWLFQGSTVINTQKKSTTTVRRVGKRIRSDENDPWDDLIHDTAIAAITPDLRPRGSPNSRSMIPLELSPTTTTINPSWKTAQESLRSYDTGDGLYLLHHFFTMSGCTSGWIGVCVALVNSPSNLLPPPNVLLNSKMRDTLRMCGQPRDELDLRIIPRGELGYAIGERNAGDLLMSGAESDEMDLLGIGEVLTIPLEEKNRPADVV
eukprot:PhF_6_TR31371/c0_g1_i1/m.45936